MKFGGSYEELPQVEEEEMVINIFRNKNQRC